MSAIIRQDEAEHKKMMVWSQIKGLISLLYLACVTIVLCLGLYCVAIVGFLMPLPSYRLKLRRWCEWFPNAWITAHLYLAQYWLGVHWNIQLPPHLSTEEWVIVVSNHQSWTDPFAVHAALHKKAPFLKFFCKQDIMFIPFINFACYALGFPMLKRYSKEKLEKNPSLRKRDVAETLKSCEQLRWYPSGFNNFLEGTRWTPKKYAKSHSPFKHLLPIKTGGVAYGIQALHNKLERILDVTVLYKTRTVSFWDYLCGKVKDIKVVVREYPIPELIKRGNYAEDAAYRAAFKDWLTIVWKNKDQLIDEHLKNQ